MWRGRRDSWSTLLIHLPIMWGTWALLASVLAVGYANPEVATNQWLVQLKGGLGSETARLVAKRNGFSFVSPVSVCVFLYVFCVLCDGLFWW